MLGGGTAIGTTVDGGYEYVFAGGSASGTVISAGTLEIASGASANLVTFSGGGTLLLDDAVQFNGLVAGFNVPADRLDLLDIAFISGTTTSSWTQLTSGANASGTLTIGDGTSGTTANITLIGQYTAADFTVTSDGLGGTLVTDPPKTAKALRFCTTTWRPLLAGGEDGTPKPANEGLFGDRANQNDLVDLAGRSNLAKP